MGLISITFIRSTMRMDRRKSSPSSDSFTVVEDVGHILDWKGTIPEYNVKQFFFDGFKAALEGGNLSQKQNMEVS